MNTPQKNAASNTRKNSGTNLTPFYEVSNRNRSGSRRKESHDPRVLKICADVIHDIYMSRIRNTIEATYFVAMLRVFELQRELDAEHQSQGANAPKSITLRPPTRYLIRRLIEEIPPFDRYAARFGRQAAARKFRFKDRSQVTVCISGEQKNSSC